MSVLRFKPDHIIQTFQIEVSSCIIGVPALFIWLNARTVSFVFRSPINSFIQVIKQCKLLFRKINQYVGNSYWQIKRGEKGVEKRSPVCKLYDMISN